MAAMDQAESVLVSGALNAAGDRWTSLNPEKLANLWRLVADQGGILLIEADGARRRWIKAPAKHEPAIPPFSDLVVPMIGMQVWGRDLDEKIAHRPALLADHLGIELGDQLDDSHLVTWATDYSLALKNVPDRARVRILINQVETELYREAARRIAARSLDQSRLEALVLANVGRESGWVESIGRVAGIVLAAGGSSRSEGQKLLYLWRGKPLVRHVVEQGLQAGLEPMVVVLGESANALRAVLEDLPVVFVENHDWQQGQSTSVRVGLSAIETRVEGAVFLLGDMPLVTSELIEAVLVVHQRSLAPIVAPWADERWGNPVLFDRVTFGDLDSLEGDRGGRHIYDRYPILPVPAGQESLFDCDTSEDLAWLTSHYP
jgi:molybdenum cofactor cytidylyltransferase